MLPESVRQDAVALWKQGIDRKEIAARLDISITTVRTYTSGVPRSAPTLTAVLVPTETLAALAPHASRRNISPHDLARRLLAICADESLVDGILDDQGGT